MSTLPIPTPGAGTQVTGIDSQDQERLIQQAVQAEIQKLQLQQQAQTPGFQPPTPAAPEPIKLSVLGQEYTFNSPEEASRTVEAALLQVRQAAYQEAQAGAANNAPKPAAPQQDGFTTEKFAELVNEDPAKGINYLLSHKIFGGQVEDAYGTLRQQIQAADEQRRVLAAYQFRAANPDFPGTEQAVYTINQLRDQLNLPPDRPESWEAAWAIAKQRGAVQVPQQVPQYPQYTTQPVPQQAPPQNYQQAPPQGAYPGQAPYGGPVAPPALGRSAHAPAPDWVSQAENLPIDQLEQLLKQFNQ